ncbi:MAG: hypothetical protein LBF41_01375 [Deltaproteobacteria bacterium]|jgi:ABC-2 type transport system permease protein|nr:hypothetical protein [Deltaproteobacteria bacterium]
MPRPRAKNILTLAVSEWKSFFTGPAGGLGLVVFLVLSGLVLYNSLAAYAVSNLEAMSRGLAMDANLLLFSGSLEKTGLILALVTPLTTMRAYSLNTAGGHLDLLFALPLSRLEIVLGHFAASVLTLFFLTVLGSLPHVILILHGAGSFGVLLTSFLGFFLLIMAFSALGLAVSAWTSSPLASALLTLGILGIFWALGWAAPYFSQNLSFLAQGLAFGPRLGHFALGLVDFNDVLYFLTLAVAGICLARPYPD